MKNWLSQRFFILSGYVNYFLQAKSLNAVHSPFVFELYRDIILNDNLFYKYRVVEALRSTMKHSKLVIDTIELGAGSNILSTKQKKVSDIVKGYAKPEKYGQLLFRLVNFFQPKNILELGTSLGISSLYLALPDTHSTLITHEGCPETANVARKNFKALNIKNIEVVTGNFDDTFSSSLQKIQKADFIFFDGNHRKEPTLRYFKDALRCADSNSVFVFDDIHWSREMVEAWDEIKKHPSVITTIDLFFVGIVLFRKEMTKEDFVLRY